MATRLQDSFTDANGTALDAHAMNVGTGWTEYEGQWDIQSNQANVASTGTGQEVAAADAGAADVTVDCDLTLGSGTRNAGVVANLSDNSNYWLFIYSSPTASWTLYSREGGTFTIRAKMAESVANGAHTFRVVTAGDRIDCYRVGDATAKCSFNASGRSNKTATRFGIRRRNTQDGTTTFDNFLVSDASSTNPFLAAWARRQTRIIGGGVI